MSKATNSSDLVSILIPTFRTTWLRECIESALNQTYKNTEIIVYNTSGKAVRDICFEYPVNYVEHDMQEGGIKFTELFNMARGDYIKFICDDDKLKPTCVEVLKRGLDMDGVTLATSHRTLIDADGKVLPKDPGINMFWDNNERIMNGRIMLNLIARRRANVIGETTTTLFRKSDLIETFQFQGWREHRSGDITMWAELMTKGNLYYTPLSQSYFRQHDGQDQRSADYLETATRFWVEFSQKILEYLNNN